MLRVNINNTNKLHVNTSTLHVHVDIINSYVDIKYLVCKGGGGGQKYAIIYYLYGRKHFTLKSVIQFTQFYAGNQGSVLRVKKIDELIS